MSILILLGLSLMGGSAIAGQIIYVDADAPGANDGSSWCDAYNYLQDALAVASSGDEIRVAEGTYKPDSSTSKPAGTGDRRATFQLISGVMVRGSYAGCGQGDPDAWDPEVYETVLSGDIGEPGVIADNSYHVVTGSGTDANAILDGFTITAGNANASPSVNRYGAGMYNESGSPTVTDCTFSGNSAEYGGGGMYNQSGTATVDNCTFSGNSAQSGGGMGNWNNANPTVTNCTFSENSAGIDDGGGMYNDNSSPNVSNCTFSGNSAYLHGGGMYNNSSSPAVINCMFSENVVLLDDGGGMYNNNSSPNVSNCTFSRNLGGWTSGGMYNVSGNPTVTNCAFSGNIGQWGGGMCNTDSNLTVTNCTFSGNSASLYQGGAMTNGGLSGPNNLVISNCTFSGNSAASFGGGMRNYSCSPTVINCTFSGNSAGSGGGAMYNYYGSSPTLTNCIFWQNGPDQILGDAPGDNPSVAYSDIQGGWEGEGNIDSDPQFVDADGSDDIVGTEDDNFRLLPHSPCVNAGDNNAVPPWVLTDLDGKARIINDTVDMGAYESEFTTVYYVDGVDGSDLNDGRTPETAFATIQKGIEEANDGEAVLVYPCVYNEEVVFLGKAITVKSIEDAAVISAPGGNAVSFLGWEDANTVLKNFVIANSYRALLFIGSSPTIEFVTVADNNQGAVADEFSFPTISSSIFWDNRDGDLFGCEAQHSWRQERTVAIDDSNLVAHWTFGEGSGTIAYDSAGSNDATLVNGPTWTSGQIGGALSFDGEDDYVEVANSEALDSPHQITISSWIYLHSKMFHNVIVAKATAYDNGYYFLVNGAFVHDTAREGGVLVVNVGEADDYLRGPPINTGKWYHVACTFDAEAERLYVNGAKVRDRAAPVSSIRPSGSNLRIGKSTTVHWNPFDLFCYFNGTIDDVRIYDRALSAEEIQETYQLGFGPLFADANNGDYHLKSECGRYWPEHNVWVLDDETSPCVDRGDPAVNPADEPMPNGGLFNMGAHGNTAYASMSEWAITGDLDRSGRVNMVDFAMWALDWLEEFEWAAD